MGGTKEGGQQAAKKMLARDPDWYKKIGSRGGKVEREGRGFAGMSKEKLAEIGKKGGTISSRSFSRAAYLERVRQYAITHNQQENA